MSGLHWYMPRVVKGDPATIIAGLRQLGAVFEVENTPPAYAVEYDRGQRLVMKAVGRVMSYDDGEIVCLFRDPLTTADVRVMLGSVEDVIFGDDVPSDGSGWSRGSHDGRPRWVSSVRVPVTEEQDTMVARILRDVERDQGDQVGAVSRLLEAAGQQGGAS